MTKPSIEVGGIPLGILSMALVWIGSVESFAIVWSLSGLQITYGPALLILVLSVGIAGIYWHWLGQGHKTAVIPEIVLPRTPWVVRAFAALAVLIYVSLWVLAYALPDFSYDALWYHIPAMHFWGLAGRIHWITADLPSTWDPLINNCLNGFPKGVELVTFVLVRATGLSRLANAVNLPFLPLGMLGLVALSRLLGANRTFSLLAGALFVLVPVNIGQAVTAYVDTATAAVYIAAFALLAETLVRLGRGELFWRGLPALGAAAGLAMSAKTPGTIFPLLFAFILAGAFVAASIQGKFQVGKMISRGCCFISVFLLIAMLIGGYWPIRNYLHTGNPINPVGVEVAGWRIFPDYAWPGQFHKPYPEGTESWSQARRILASWFPNLRDWWPRTTYSSLLGGLGFLWSLGALPALVGLLAASLFRCRDRAGPAVIRHPVILMVLIMITVLLSQLMHRHHNHLARYTIWVYGIGLPAFVLAGERVWQARGRFRRLLGRVWVTAVIILTLGEGISVWFYNLEMTSRYWEDWETPPPLVSRLFRSLTHPYPSGYAAGSLAAGMIRGQAPAALGPLHDRRVLMLGRLAEGSAFGERKIYFLDLEIAGDAGDLKRYLRKRDLRFVVWDEEEEVPLSLNRLSRFREFTPGGFRLFAYSPFSGLSPFFRAEIR